MRTALITPPEADLADLLKQPIGAGVWLQELMDDVARHFIEQALEKTRGNKTKASQILGLGSYQTLSNWMERLGVELPATGTDPAVQEGPA